MSELLQSVGPTGRPLPKPLPQPKPKKIKAEPKSPEELSKAQARKHMIDPGDIVNIKLNGPAIVISAPPQQPVRVLLPQGEFMVHREWITSVMYRLFPGDYYEVRGGQLMQRVAFSPYNSAAKAKRLSEFPVVVREKGEKTMADPLTVCVRAYRAWVGTPQQKQRTKRVLREQAVAAGQGEIE